MTARTSALNVLILGVDVQSGDAPSYAVVAFDGVQFDRSSTIGC